MTLSIDIDTRAFRRLNKKHFISIKEAMPQAMRRGLRDGRTKAAFEVSKAVGTRLNRKAVKANEVKALVKKETKTELKTNDIDKMQVTMTMPKKGFSMIRFVLGRGGKDPTPVDGVPAKQRKRVEIRIRKGSAPIKLKRAYITRAKGRRRLGGNKVTDNTQVFQDSSRAKPRANGKKGRFALTSQSIASLSLKFLPVIKPLVSRKMRTSFESSLRFLLRGKG